MLTYLFIIYLSKTEYRVHESKDLICFLHIYPQGLTQYLALRKKESAKSCLTLVIT